MNRKCNSKNGELVNIMSIIVPFIRICEIRDFIYILQTKIYLFLVPGINE